jgi:ssDNA-binding Zn-finger/Zn-ribbon topoisomerase 1
MVKRPQGRPKVKRPYTRRTPFLLRESMSESDAFCVKCRDPREIKEPRAVSLANGRSALQGACPVCATLLTRIVKAEEKMPGPEATSAPAKRPRGRPRLVRPAPLPDRASKPDSQGYCMKCRDTREIEDPEAVTLANGRSALEGACPVCGTHMIRIVKAKKTDQQ